MVEALAYRGEDLGLNRRHDPGEDRRVAGLLRPLDRELSEVGDALVHAGEGTPGVSQTVRAPDWPRAKWDVTCACPWTVTSR